jgi:hypothetical protein
MKLLRKFWIPSSKYEISRLEKDIIGWGDWVEKELTEMCENPEYYTLKALKEKRLLINHVISIVDRLNEKYAGYFVGQIEPIPDYHKFRDNAITLLELTDYLSEARAL